MTSPFLGQDPTFYRTKARFLGQKIFIYETLFARVSGEDRMINWWIHLHLSIQINLICIHIRNVDCDASAIVYRVRGFHKHKVHL